MSPAVGRADPQPRPAREPGAVRERPADVDAVEERVGRDARLVTYVPAQAVVDREHPGVGAEEGGRDTVGPDLRAHARCDRARATYVLQLVDDARGETALVEGADLH